MIRFGRNAILGTVIATLLVGCGGDEPTTLTNSAPSLPETPVEIAVEPELVETPESSDSEPLTDEPMDSLAGLESSVVVPNVNLNFARGAEDACVAALALTRDGVLRTSGFTYDDKSCRRLIDSIPMPELPKNDVDTAYLRGFQEMLSIMFRPGELCATNGECFVKEDVLPVLP